jgi:predicted amidohydrolase
VKLRVAGAQIPVSRDVSLNLAAILRSIEAAGNGAADILLTPEGSLSGYTHAFDQAAVARALEEVRDAARRRGLGLALGTCFVERDGLCYDQLRFYDTDGSYLGFHSKTLTCGTLGVPSRGEVEHFSVAPLRTFTIKGIPCGGLVCNDMWANPGYTPVPDPHLSQKLADAGARIVFHSVNGDRDGSAWSTDSSWNYHKSNLELRARAGRLFIVTVDNCAPLDVPCASPGGVVGPEGTWLARTPRQGEHVFVFDVGLEETHERAAGRHQHQDGTEAG